MKEARISPGKSSRQYSLIVAIVFTILGVNQLSRGIREDREFGLVMSVAAISLGVWFLFEWLRWRRGLWMIAYDDDVFQIREGSNIRISSTFADLKVVDQDGRGYTIITQVGSRFRLLRKDMGKDLELLLDGIQNAEQAAALQGRH